MKSRLIIATLLVLILAVSATFRFYRLPDQGILGVDEGRYVLDALSKRAELEACRDIARGKLAELRGGPDFVLADHVRVAHETLAEQHPFAPKPGFAYASALVMSGTDNVISSCSYLEATCGVVMVALVFGFVWQIRNARAGLIAAGLLGVSVYHIYYSRNAYPQCSTGVLFLLAVWCHVRWYSSTHCTPASVLAPDDSTHVARSSVVPMRGTYAWLFGCGVFAGLAFWFNYQIAGVLPALPLLHIVLGLRPGRAAAWLKELVVIGIGFAVVMLLAEAQTYPLIFLFRRYGLTYPHGTFFELLLPRLLGQSAAPWNGSGWVLLPYFISVLEGSYYAGAILITLALGGAYVAVRTIRDGKAGGWPIVHPAVVYIAIPVATAYIVFSFKTMQGARTFVTIVPFLITGAAMTVDAAARSQSRWFLGAMSGPFVFFLASLFLFFPGRLNEVLTIRSAYPEVMKYVREQDPPAACASWSAVLEAYGASEGIETASIYRYLERGKPAPDYVSDWQELYNRRMPDQAAAIESTAAPAAEFTNKFGRIFLTIEAFPSFGNARENIEWSESLDLERARKVLVYEMRSDNEALVFYE